MNKQIYIFGNFEICKIFTTFQSMVERGTFKIDSNERMSKQNIQKKVGKHQN